MRDEWRKAAIDGDLPIIERLLGDGAGIDSRDRYGQTALMLAARHGRGEIVNLLLRHGAALDATAKYGLSALMLAVINRHPDIARQLVDAGADIRLRATGAPGFANQTARDLAVHHGLPDVAAWIERAERQKQPSP